MQITKIILAIIAAFFTLIVFNNITDYVTNFECVQSVLGMEGVQAKSVMWRAIQAPWLITSAYVSIIATEAVIAILLWYAVFRRDTKFSGTVGLSLGFGLFMFGFVVIGGEWFYMWQHPVFAGLQQKAAIFSLIMLGGLLHLQSHK